MGTVFVTCSKSVSKTRDYNYIPTISVKSQMNHVIWHWLRKYHCIPFPEDIIDLLIDIYTFQPIFDMEHADKLTRNTKPVTTGTAERPGYDHLFKLVLIGSLGVGKTALHLRYTDNCFVQAYISTIGVDFRFKTIQIENETVKMQLWDTAGQERFRTITSPYYRGAHGVLLVYDVTDRESFDDIIRWNDQIDKYKTNCVHKVLIGNKSDLSQSVQVTFHESQELCKKLNIATCIETSAKNNVNVDDAFNTLAKELCHSKKRISVPFWG
eukprot:603576_1